MTITKALFSVIVLSIIACGNETKSKAIISNKNILKNTITLIFKKNSSSDKESNFQSGIYYSEFKKYIARDISPQNISKDDTLSIAVSEPSICLTYNFKNSNSFIFEFQAGDTIIFDYSTGLPRATLTNRKALQYDLNFQTDTKIQRPLEDFQFVQNFKRIRNADEKHKYQEELKNYAEKSNQLLDSLYENKLISKGPYAIQKARVDFYVLNINKNKIEPDNVISGDLKRDDLLYLKTYRYFLENYTLKKFKISKTNDFTDDSRQIFDAVSNSTVFSEKTKSYLLFNAVKNIAENNSSQDLKKYTSKFQVAVSDKETNDYINNHYLTDLIDLKKEIKTVYIIDSKRVKFKLDEFITDQKGKVIFIDFWASWCGPCRAAMPSALRLRNEYKDKDVVYLYISIDSDFEAWKKACDKEGLTLDKNCFLAVNYPNADLYQKLQLKNIPRYLIYDKTGKMVHQNAPGPESNQIRDELNKYLAE